MPEPLAARDGFTTIPTTAEEAAALLDKVADARAEYITGHSTDDDIKQEVGLLHAAAKLIRTGEIWAWVPTWTNERFS